MNVNLSPQTIEDPKFWQAIEKKNSGWKPLPETEWDKTSIANQNDLTPSGSVRKLFQDFPLEPGTVIDIGCGAGPETIFLLKQKWNVIALDTNQRALDILKANVQKTCGNLSPSLQIVNQSMETYPFATKVRVAFAQATLPFCNPKKFKDVWNRLVDSIEPEGVLYCDFYMKKAPGVIVLDLAQVQKLMETSFDNCQIVEAECPPFQRIIYAIGQRKKAINNDNKIESVPTQVNEVESVIREISTLIDSKDSDSAQFLSTIQERNFNLLLRQSSKSPKHIDLLRCLLKNRLLLNIDIQAKGKTSGTALDVATKFKNQVAIDLLGKIN